MIYNCKVTYDGSHYVASIPDSWGSGGGGYNPRKWDSILFDEYYQRAQAEGVSDGRIASYIEDNIRRDRDIVDWISSERCSQLLKNKKRSIHKRYKRYEGKLYLTDFNWYVTFTYDSLKETAESFEARLKKCFSNFKCRKNWRVVGVPEDGEENGRRHWHCFIKIPEGSMVGELFLNKKFSTKRKKYETWTDNTYFNDRFGQSKWEAITKEDLRHGGALRGYLLKYLQKSGNKMFYSRDLPHELYVEVDTDTDVACTYYNYGYKSVLFDNVVKKVSSEELNSKYNHTFKYNRGDGFNVEKLIERFKRYIQISDRDTTLFSQYNRFEPVLLY